MENFIFCGVHKMGIGNHNKCLCNLHNSPYLQTTPAVKELRHRDTLDLDLHWQTKILSLFKSLTSFFSYVKIGPLINFFTTVQI